MDPESRIHNLLGQLVFRHVRLQKNNLAKAQRRKENLIRLRRSPAVLGTAAFAGF